eukprot:CAMPEP_0179155268 /NCGR_PEP_ID=MMETSP0796-20121207/75623_1 /TAXON_ID=73915 /ORGANISM="Pyrodinium bahamense, Strain pbaha01" /LENGTH=93 /DNA_ID=CAMNT_0020856735 /DNA_START=37 /DNA_END=315 /DNA_ORIENTATION=+
MANLLSALLSPPAPHGVITQLHLRQLGAQVQKHPQSIDASLLSQKVAVPHQVEAVQLQLCHALFLEPHRQASECRRPQTCAEHVEVPDGGAAA